jgi:hypothetical protein
VRGFRTAPAGPSRHALAPALVMVGVVVFVVVDVVVVALDLESMVALRLFARYMGRWRVEMACGRKRRQRGEQTNEH